MFFKRVFGIILKQGFFLMFGSTFFGCFLGVFNWVFFPQIFKIGLFYLGVFLGVFILSVFLILFGVFFGCFLVVFFPKIKKKRLPGYQCRMRWQLILGCIDGNMVGTYYLLTASAES